MSGSTEEDGKQDAKTEKKMSGKSRSVEEIGFGVALKDKRKDDESEGGRYGGKNSREEAGVWEKNWKKNGREIESG